MRDFNILFVPSLCAFSNLSFNLFSLDFIVLTRDVLGK